MSAMKVTKSEAAYLAEGTTRYFIDDADLKAEGIELCAKFPKSARVGLYRAVSVEAGERSRAYYFLRFEAKLAADGANGGVNETGIKRIASFEKAAAKLGVDLV